MTLKIPRRELDTMTVDNARRMLEADPKFVKHIAGCPIIDFRLQSQEGFDADVKVKVQKPSVQQSQIVMETM